MCKRLRSLIKSATIATVLVALMAAVPTIRPMITGAVSAPAAEPAAPESQTYVGAKVCASCHFKHYMTWKGTKHADTFKLLPEKYRTDGTCLKCHSTGYGTSSGFKDIESTPSLAGNSCEVCHGPGSKHADVCKAFGTKLTAVQEKAARDSIWKIIPTNICIECHLTQAHKESVTPKELRGK